MSNTIEKIKSNPLQAVTVGIAIAGAFFSVANFYILSKMAPLERRVAAIEKRNEAVDPLVTRFIQLEQRDEALVKDVAEIKADVQKILDLHIKR